MVVPTETKKKKQHTAEPTQFPPPAHIPAIVSENTRRSSRFPHGRSCLLRHLEEGQRWRYSRTHGKIQPGPGRDSTGATRDSSKPTWGRMLCVCVCAALNKLQQRDRKMHHLVSLHSQSCDAPQQDKLRVLNRSHTMTQNPRLFFIVPINPLILFFLNYVHDVK